MFRISFFLRSLLTGLFLLSAAPVLSAQDGESQECPAENLEIEDAVDTDEFILLFVSSRLNVFADAEHTPDDVNALPVHRDLEAPPLPPPR